MIDCVYIAASAHDARYTRICVASIRYFYPEVPVRLLVGGPLQRGLADELRRYWNVEITRLPAQGDYGWGFVKLEALFGRSGEKFLVLDSDTVITGPVLEKWRDSHAPFLVDDETQTEADAKRIYYDWKNVSKIDSQARAPEFLFNSGQWFGTAGVLTQADFAPWLEWSMPRRTLPVGLFMNGDQGILNYVLNQKAAREGLCVERRQIMRWPGHSMDGLKAETVSKRQALPLVIHWAGMKKVLLRKMIGADILLYFEKFYYSRLPGGLVRRFWNNCRDLLTQVKRWFGIAFKLTYHRRIGPAMSWPFSRGQKPSVEI
jgi:hypothetical protein